MMITTENGKRYVDVDELILNDKNFRATTTDAFMRLKEQIQMGQHSPIAVTSEGVVISGNMRLRAYKDLNIVRVWITLIDFEQEPEGWHAVIDGEPVRSKYFSSKEDAIMAYGLSFNDRAGHYTDEFINHMVEFNLKWNDYAADFTPPKSIAEFEPPTVLNAEEQEQKVPTKFQILLEFEDAQSQNANFVELTNQGYKGKLITN